MSLDVLSKKLRTCPNPPEMVSVEHRLKGWGFYPAAQGYEGTEIPVGGVMLLARDWGAVDDFYRFVDSPEQSETGRTSKRTRTELMPLLEAYGVWRTNYLPGFRRSRPSTGNLKKVIKDKGHWKTYEEFAWLFLQEQVCLQRPRLLIALGIPNQNDLTSEDRISKMDRDSFLEYTFSTEHGAHKTIVTFLDHPYAISNPKVRERYSRKVQMILSYLERSIASS